MNIENKITNIERDIQNGLKHRAADRLRNMINSYPNETRLWNRLAELYYESGFLASAGKYWILSEPIEDRIKTCVEIYEKSVNYSGTKILQDITFRGDKSKLCEFGKNKLSQLEIDSQEKSKYIPEFKPFNDSKKHKNEEPSLKDKFNEMLFYTVLLSIGIFIIVGIITVFSWIF